MRKNPRKGEKFPGGRPVYSMSFKKLSFTVEQEHFECGCGDIEQDLHAIGDDDELPFLRHRHAAPGVHGGPQVHVREGISTSRRLQSQRKIFYCITKHITYTTKKTIIFPIYCYP